MYMYTLHVFVSYKLYLCGSQPNKIWNLLAQRMERELENVRGEVGARDVNSRDKLNV